METSTGLITHVYSTLKKRNGIFLFKCLAGGEIKILGLVVLQWKRSQVINMPWARVIHTHWATLLMGRFLSPCLEEALPALAAIGAWSL